MLTCTYSSPCQGCHLQSQRSPKTLLLPHHKSQYGRTGDYLKWGRSAGSAATRGTAPGTLPATVDNSTCLLHEMTQELLPVITQPATRLAWPGKPRAPIQTLRDPRCTWGHKSLPSSRLLLKDHFPEKPSLILSCYGFHYGTHRHTRHFSSAYDLSHPLECQSHQNKGRFFHR